MPSSGERIRLARRTCALVGAGVKSGFLAFGFDVDAPIDVNWIDIRSPCAVWLHQLATSNTLQLK